MHPFESHTSMWCVIIGTSRDTEITHMQKQRSDCESSSSHYSMASEL